MPKSFRESKIYATFRCGAKAVNFHSKPALGVLSRSGGYFSAYGGGAICDPTTEMPWKIDKVPTPNWGQNSGSQRGLLGFICL
jgi:hypothetical protein